MHQERAMAMSDPYVLSCILREENDTELGYSLLMKYRSGW